MTAAVIILCVVALIILLLYVPLKVEVRGNLHNNLDLRFRFKYLFGLVCWESGRMRKAAKPQVKDFSWLSRFYHAAQTEGIYERSCKLVKYLRRRMKVESVDVDLSVSLGDDYYTGTVIGYLIALALFINRQFNTAIKLSPAFEEDLLLDGYIYAGCRAIPAHILVPCLSYILSNPFRRAHRRYCA